MQTFTIKPLVWHLNEHSGTYTCYTIFGKVYIDGSDTAFWDIGGAHEDTGFATLHDAQVEVEVWHKKRLCEALEAIVRPVIRFGKTIDRCDRLAAKTWESLD